jgi:hypothetical protein
VLTARPIQHRLARLRGITAAPALREHGISDLGGARCAHVVHAGRTVEIGEADHPLLGAQHDGAQRPWRPARIGQHLAAPEADQPARLPREVVREAEGRELPRELQVPGDQGLRQRSREQHEIQTRSANHRHRPSSLAGWRVARASLRRRGPAPTRWIVTPRSISRHRGAPCCVNRRARAATVTEPPCP